MRRETMLARLGEALSPSRFDHTLGVEMAALELAAMVGEDAPIVSQAALLHDCAKYLSAPRMLRIIDEGGMEIDQVTRLNPSLLHAPAGAVMARDLYHVVDRRVLEAIRWHTTGRAHMERLSALIYLADVVEPHRESYASLDEVREAVRSDLNRALLLAVYDTLDYVRARLKPVHPDSLALRDWLDAGARPFD